MKNGNLYEVKSIISAIKDYGSNKFMLPMVLNEMDIDERIKALEELKSPSEQFSKYLEAKEEIKKNGSKEFQEFQEKTNLNIKEHSKKDNNGDLMLFENQDGSGKRKYDYGFPCIIDLDGLNVCQSQLNTEYHEVIQSENARLTKAFEDLDAEYSEVIKIQEKKEKRYQDALMEECDIVFRSVSIADFPELPKDFPNRSEIFKSFVKFKLIEI